jgi:hypothetical protein
MEIIEIPDYFYINSSCLCHKSCIRTILGFSNRKYICTHDYPISNGLVAFLRLICNRIDEIEEKTYFVGRKFNNLWYTVSYGTNLWLRVLNYPNKIFNNLNEFLEYLNKNYPECIRNDDIKIALKD